MHRRTLTRGTFVSVVIALCGAGGARASFHAMQIEQVIAGVNGDTTAQAIQLRMRTGAQNFVSAARLRAWDAAGANPIVVINFAANVPNDTGGDRILVVSPAMVGQCSPAAVGDFVMTTPIPAGYLAAGSLTFESDGGAIYWRLSWGGASYTGPTTGLTENDLDGDFGPPVPGPLPSTTTQALRFQGPFNARSTNNAADYAVTSGSAVLTNNAAQSFTVVGGGSGGECPGDTNGDRLVDNADLQAVLDAWASSTGDANYDADADLNDDGQVENADLQEILDNWSEICP
jgi:hypothetical protein